MWKKIALLLYVVPIVTVAVILITLPYHHCTADLDLNNPDYFWRLYPPILNYTYGVCGLAENEYDVIVPIALNGTNESMFSLADYSIVKGNTSFNYVQTDYGSGLDIKGRGNFTLHAESLFKNRADQRFKTFSLSAQNVTSSEGYGHGILRMHLNQSIPGNLTLAIWCAPEATPNVIFGLTDNTTLTGGWQNIKVTYSMMLVETSPPPPPSNITILEGQTRTFGVITDEYDIANLSFSWYVNGRLVSSNSTNYTFITNYTSAGTYSITVVVSGDESNTTHSWNVTVVDTNHGDGKKAFIPYVNFIAVINIIIIAALIEILRKRR